MPCGLLSRKYLRQVRRFLCVFGLRQWPLYAVVSAVPDRGSTATQVEPTRTAYRIRLASAFSACGVTFGDGESISAENHGLGREGYTLPRFFTRAEVLLRAARLG